MNITFDDPGLDPTYYIVTGIITLVPAVLALICVVVHFMRSTRHSKALEWAFGFSMATIVMVVFGIGIVGSAGTFTGYNHRVDEAKYAEMGRQGFELIRIEEADGRESPRVVHAEYKGKEFWGTMENLNYPTGYTFKITETEKK